MLLMRVPDSAEPIVVKHGDARRSVAPLWCSICDSAGAQQVLINCNTSDSGTLRFMSHGFYERLGRVFSLSLHSWYIQVPCTIRVLLLWFAGQSESCMQHKRTGNDCGEAFLRVGLLVVSLLGPEISVGQA
jgi:hypothetical protein